MSDVCELAHIRTIRECNKNDICLEFEDEGIIFYTPEAQKIFNAHYDYIISVTGL